jgi:hypothetical protein
MLGKVSHEGRKENQMNIVHQTILHACWQEENERGMHAPRPWLRWFLTRMVGMKNVPARESVAKQRRREQWLAVRKEAALQIDPETAEVDWTYAQTLDPYGVDPDLPEEYQQIGRGYFARSPGSDVWVSFYDLPEATCDRLWARIHAGEFTDDLNWLFDEPVSAP